MKYKKGDIVKIREDLIADRQYAGVTVISVMKNFARDRRFIAKIDEVRINSIRTTYILEGCPGYNWVDDMFEGIFESPEMLRQLCEYCKEKRKCPLVGVKACKNLRALIDCAQNMFSKDFKMPKIERVKEENEFVEIENERQLAHVLFSVKDWQYISGSKVFTTDAKFTSDVRTIYERLGAGAVVMLMHKTKRVRVFPKDAPVISESGSAILKHSEWSK